MSPFGGRGHEGGATGQDRGQEEQRAHLRERAVALSEAVARGGRELEPVAAGRAVTVAAKVDERTALAGDHTIVALAGATGSGKSSLTNALAGAQVTEPGIKRPTTSTTSASRRSTRTRRGNSAATSKPVVAETNRSSSVSTACQSRRARAVSASVTSWNGPCSSLG